MKLSMIALASIFLALVLCAALLYTPDKSRAALDAAYHVPPTDYRTIDGLRLHLVDAGPRAAPAVILLHGFGSSLETWGPWAARLSVHYRVIRYDLPGFGLTGPDPTGNYSDRRGLQILAAVMDSLGLERASLIGNSLGGKLAWSFAAQYPARVDRLILISPDGFASPGFEYGKSPKIPATLKLLRLTLPRLLVRVSLAPAYGNPTQLTPTTVTRYRDMMLAPGVRAAMLDRLTQVLLTDPHADLARIQAPTLILWGEQDRMIPFSNAQDYLKAIPHAELIALPGLGHVPFEEAPDATYPQVEQFLGPRG
jgi:pimeloyl-ACP methyl ester carboxylesterase